MVNRQFLVIFLFVTIAFSFFAYQPIDVVIAGPQMTDLEKFEIELKSIEDSTGIKIKYETYSDIETYLIENSDSDVDIAIIPNPQGVTNLGEIVIILSIARTGEIIFCRSPAFWVVLRIVSGAEKKSI